MKEDQPRYMEVILQSGDDAIEVLAGEWRDLHHRIEGATYRQSLEHARHAWQYFANVRGRELVVVMVRVNAQPVLIWPFVRRHRTGRRVAVWLGVEFDYRDVIAVQSPERAAWIMAAWQEAKARLGVDLIWIPAVRDTALSRNISDREPHALVRHDPTLSLALERWPDWQSFRQALPRKFVREQDRRLRNLSRHGNVSFSVMDNSDDIERAVNWMVQRKRKWARGAAASTPFDEPYRIYLIAICRDAFAAGDLLLGVLTLDQEIIAAEIDIVDGPRLEMLIAAYDREWNSFGPGLLLFDRMLAWAFDRNVTLVDFRIGAERYKRNYPVDWASLNSYLVPCTARGRLVMAWRRMDLANRARKSVRDFPWIRKPT